MIESDGLIAEDIQAYKEKYHTDDPIFFYRTYDAMYEEYFDDWFLSTLGYEHTQHIAGANHLLTNKKLKEIIFLIEVSSRIYDVYIPPKIRERLYGN